MILVCLKGKVTEMNIAYLEYCVNVNCPECGWETDISQDDEDAIVANAIFNNNWDSLKGFDVTCSHCSLEFTLDSVEY